MDRDRLVEEVRALEGLGGVIRWALARSPRAGFVDVVIQDEFTHDVVVRVDSSRLSRLRHDLTGGGEGGRLLGPRAGR